MSASAPIQFDRLRVGDALPALAVPIDVSTVVTMAVATRDFHPVHHNVEVAREAGHPTLFVNIMSTAGLIERFLREWSGDAGRLVALKLRLGVPHYAGETLSVSGRVVALSAAGSNCWSDIEVTGTNPRGQHASAQARIVWPTTAASLRRHGDKR